MSTMEGEDRELARWFQAEADGRLEDADIAFAGLMARNAPRLQPSAGFSAATVARALDATQAWPWWMRALIAASVGLAGVPLAWVQGLGLFDLVAVLGTEAAPVAASLASVVHWGASIAASTWRLSALVGEAALTACLNGPGPLIILTNLALAVVGFLGLRRLLAPPKECW